jgi:hypothetical protein
MGETLSIAHRSALMQSRYAAGRRLDQARLRHFPAAFPGNRLFLGRTDD